MTPNEIIMEISKLAHYRMSDRWAFMATPEEHRVLSLHFSDGYEDCLQDMEIMGVPIVAMPRVESE